MNDVTLWTVNWNQKNALELLLRSYLKFHPETPIKTLIVDNNSSDDSRQFLKQNQIPFFGLDRNVGHEMALQFSMSMIKTKYALLVDSDIRFQESIQQYFDLLKDNVVSVGELLSAQEYDGTPLKPRVGAWFILFDIEKLREKGIRRFRGTGDWTYDTGSWFWEKIRESGFTNHHIHGNFSPIGTDYGRFFHYSQLSNDTEKHGLTPEVAMRRADVIEQLKSLPKDSLAGMFEGENRNWSNSEIDQHVEGVWDRDH